VVPKRHVAWPENLNEQERLDGLRLIDEILKAFKKALHVQGVNVGANLGEAAGAGIPKHMHWHVVPRWRGDTNFMPVIAKTKVVSTSLDFVYKILSSQLKDA